jgi:hypothetical protein
VGGIEIDMSWLNANEYRGMDASVRERVQDLRETADVALLRAEGDEAPREGDDPARGRSDCGGVITCGVHTTRRVLRELRAAAR